MVRLETISVSLAAQLRAAPVSRRLDAILAVCTDAAAETASLHAAIQNALQSRAAPNPALKVQLETLRDELDEQYFAAQELAENDGSDATLALNYFSEARLAAALALAMDVANEAVACESLYEALMALSDSKPTITRLELQFS